MKLEFWRNIYGYKGIYQISNYGNTKSFKYKEPRILKKGINSRGYFYVNLCMNGKYKSCSVHRLVAKEFVKGNIQLTVNHKDENKKNNYFENLEWLTKEDNYKYFIKNSVYKIKGENNGRSKLKKNDVDNIRILYKTGKHTVKSLSFKYKVSKSHIFNIVNNKRWVN